MATVGHQRCCFIESTKCPVETREKLSRTPTSAADRQRRVSRFRSSGSHQLNREFGDAGPSEKVVRGSAHVGLLMGGREHRRAALVAGARCLCRAAGPRIECFVSRVARSGTRSSRAESERAC